MLLVEHSHSSDYGGLLRLVQVLGLKQMALSVAGQLPAVFAESYTESRRPNSVVREEKYSGKRERAMPRW